METTHSNTPQKRIDDIFLEVLCFDFRREKLSYIAGLTDEEIIDSRSDFVAHRDDPHHDEGSREFYAETVDLLEKEMSNRVG